MVLVDVTHDAQGRPLPCHLKMDKYLLPNVKGLWEWIKNDWDVVALVIGREGSGKSTLTQEMALAINADFSLKDVFFTADQFIHWVNTAKPGSVGIYDEADELTAGYFDDTVRVIKSRLKRMRDKNLILFLVTPTMKDLGEYFAKHRSFFCIYVYELGADRRGFYHLYNFSDKELLFEALRKHGESRRTFFKAYKSIEKGYFPDPKTFEGGRDAWVIDYEAYKAKKAAATEEIVTKSAKKKTDKAKDARVKIVRHAWGVYEKITGEKPTHKKLQVFLGIDRTSISRYLGDAPKNERTQGAVPFYQGDKDFEQSEEVVSND